METVADLKVNRVNKEDQVQHLLLLVGSNALPNYIAARLLLKDGGCVHLLHTRQSEPVAKRLQKALGVDCRLHEPATLSASDIQGKVRDILAKIPAEASIGLHYTGGLKSMSVHAALAAILPAVAAQETPRIKLSYLDARELRLRFDDPLGGGNDDGPPVVFHCEPHLATLLDLQRWELKNKPTTEPVLPDVVDELVKVFSPTRNPGPTGDDSAARAWRKWCQALIQHCKGTNAPNAGYKSLESFAGKSPYKWPVWTERQRVDGKVIETETADLRLNRVVQKLQDCLPGACASGLIIHKAAQEGFGGKVKELCTWLDGKWLESHVLSSLQRVQAKEPKNARLHDIQMNLEFGIPVETEIDVVAMRGYQLFFFSCTTTFDRATAKHKLFEAVVRARQLGGDEARVALVCMTGDPGDMALEVAEAFHIQNDDPGKSEAQGPALRVFGYQDLRRLDDRLSDWFAEQVQT